MKEAVLLATCLCSHTASFNLNAFQLQDIYVLPLCNNANIWQQHQAQSTHNKHLAAVLN